MVMIYASGGRWHAVLVEGCPGAQDVSLEPVEGAAGQVLAEVAARYPGQLAVLVSADWDLGGVPVASMGDEQRS